MNTALCTTQFQFKTIKLGHVLLTYRVNVLFGFEENISVLNLSLVGLGTLLAGSLLMVLGDLTSVYSSMRCVSKANIASCLACCGLQIFYCEASNSNLDLYKIRFTDFHCLYHGNERTLFARNLPLPCRITDF